jgi:hypothetical protein
MKNLRAPGSWIVLVTIAIGWAVWLSFKEFTRHQAIQAKVSAEMRSNAKSVADMGFFTEAEGLQLFEMADRTERTNRLSAEDFQWFVQELHETYINDRHAAGRRQYLCLAVRRGVRNLDANHKGKMRDIAMRLVESPEPTDTLHLDTSNGLLLLGELGDSESVSTIRRFLNHKQWQIRSHAHHALTRAEKR